MAYIGNAPAEAYSNIAYQDFGTQSGTTFTLDFPAGAPGELEVFVNNVRQEPSVAYTVSGTTLTMTGTVAASDDFYVVFQGKAQQTVTHPANTALAATTGTFSSTLAVTGASTLSSTLGVTGKITSTAGITFGSDTAAANTLDDYEEGSGYAVTDVSGAGLTITTSSSAYTKIGKLVHVSMYLVFPTTSNSTQIQLSLPFAAGSVATSSFSYLNGRLQPGSPLSFESAFTCQVNPSTNNFYVGYNNSTIGSVLTYNQVSGRYILVSGCYHTDL